MTHPSFLPVLGVRPGFHGAQDFRGVVQTVPSLDSLCNEVLKLVGKEAFIRPGFGSQPVGFFYISIWSRGLLCYYLRCEVEVPREFSSVAHHKRAELSHSSRDVLLKGKADFGKDESLDVRVLHGFLEVCPAKW